MRSQQEIVEAAVEPNASVPAAEVAPPLPPSPEERLARHFRGQKAELRPVYDALAHIAQKVAKGAKADPSDRCVTFIGRKQPFAVVRVLKDRVELGLALEGAPARGRLKACRGLAGCERITHKVELAGLLAVDADVVLWMKRAASAR